uniref:F-box domain-containing protein n=1 Tax=Steinernema glaseri TaxID=37863 RepID=A0A1I7YPH2_9BILA
MDDVPFLFVNTVLHCLNSESLAAPRLLAHPLWSSVAEEHYGKRKDYAFHLIKHFNANQITMQHLLEEGHTDPEQWLRSDKTYLRVRELWFNVILSRSAPEITLEEALQWSLRMAPYLNDLNEIILFHLGGKKERFDFLWKRPCHTLSYYNYFEDTSVLRWHLQNNDRLKSTNTCLFSYDDVRDLLPLCAEKRLTWEMTFPLNSNNLNSVKTWQGDAQWDEIYPTVPAQPEKGMAFYEDEHIRKEFLWSSRGPSFFTVTWK